MKKIIILISITCLVPLAGCEKISNFKQKIINKIKGQVEETTDKVNDIKKNVENQINEVTKKVKKVKNNIENSVEKGKETIEKISDAKKKIDDALEAVGEISDTLNSAQQ